MAKYFSHYTFIYPNIHLTNHIVEFDAGDRLVNYFPYERQISGTVFVSGLLICLPHNMVLSEVKDTLLKNELYRGLIERGSMLIRSFTV